MKNALFFLLISFSALQAQPAQINANVPAGADPAALQIEFLPTDAVVLPGAIVTMDYYTTYLKGKQQPPKFKIEVRSVAAGVPNPDVNPNNNSQTGTPN